ncbi:MAG: hypothetical protein K2X93_29575 [Candidatus Obscuribacterales bacterium]|nr:hypothetical protein [Candidatus Obscuribacterales bacterium]
MSRERDLIQKLASDSGVRLSIDPRSRRQIVQDLGLIPLEVGYRTADDRKIENLRFLLYSNADGSVCETYWWDGFIATHTTMAGSLGLSYDEADLGILDLSCGIWELADTDNKGFFYPAYVRDWVKQIIGGTK